MAIKLNHTIIPCRDKDAATRFFTRIFGLSYDVPQYRFAPVQVNEALTMDFDDGWGDFDPHHNAFMVSEEEFDAMFGRIKEEGICYGSGPHSAENMEINNRRGRGRGVYFHDPNGHLLELITA